MKNVFVLFITLILTSSHANAQWNIGAKAGLNLSNINYPGSIENPSYLTGVNIGLITSYQITEPISLQAELLYSSRGYKEKDFIIMGVEAIEKKDLSCRFNYLDIPVVVRYSFSSGFNIHAGSQVGLLLSRSLKFGDEKQNNEMMGKKQFFDYGLVAGLGYTFSNNLFIDGRYLLGLNSSSKNVDSFQHRSFQVSLGYMFQL